MMEYMTITAICKQCALYNEIKLKLNYLMIPDMYMVALVIGPFWLHREYYIRFFVLLQIVYHIVLYMEFRYWVKLANEHDGEMNGDSWLRINVQEARQKDHNRTKVILPLKLQTKLTFSLEFGRMAQDIHRIQNVDICCEWRMKNFHKHRLSSSWHAPRPLGFLGFLETLFSSFSTNNVIFSSNFIYYYYSIMLRIRANPMMRFCKLMRFFCLSSAGKKDTVQRGN